METRVAITFEDADEKKTVTYSRIIIDALRKWRPDAKDFSVRVSGKEIGITVVSEK